MNMTERPGARGRLLSIHDAAGFLQVSERSIRRWITAGDLRAHKLGRQWRIAPDEIERFLATRSNHARFCVL
jgi:excisionase family DNA binding protein